ncbi:MAG: hypothetical protein IJR83_07400 [Clostridia bacterium]|nr:hypothetical protein [Clostridia bacterium]
MDFSHFSLLFPDEKTQQDHFEGRNVPDIDMFTLQELGLLELFTLKNSELAEFFTMDPAVMRYRMEAFRDMLDNEQIAETLNRLMPVLGDILELRRMESDSGDTANYLLSITEIELYISCIGILHEGLSREAENLHSDAFRTLADRIRELAESDYYKQLNKKLEELTQRVREIRSVTIGVNLDQQLRPREAGVLSINAVPFKSGDIIDKILRLNFKGDEYTCIANLVPFGKKQSDNEKTALSLAFNSAINDVYKSSLRSWKQIVQNYVLENTDFLLNLIPEFELLVRGTEFLRQLKKKGCILTEPDIRPVSDHACILKDLYNPCVALKIDGDVVPNDLDYDEQAGIYVLTGPNRGGKSVITCALGLCQVMMQLGMFVPAREAILSPVDAIYTHFPTGAEDTIDKGRLGEECARLSEIFENITSDSLVLLDESLSSTGSFEASYIASEVLAGLACAGCRCLFSTHLHELAAKIDEINELTKPRGGIRIDTLVAGIGEEGSRSFKIIRTKPDGKSYARDIAGRYGLTYDNILKMIGKQ